MTRKEVYEARRCVRDALTEYRQRQEAMTLEERVKELEAIAEAQDRVLDGAVGSGR